MELELKTKKWGNSIGVILPKEVVDDVGIKPEETIVIDVKRGLKLKDIFGLFPRTSKKTAQQIKDEMRSGW